MRSDKRAIKTLRRWYRRLWWFDVIYPVALGAVLFGILSYALYAGQPQWRLSLQAEKTLLNFSLREASRRWQPPASRVLVVSAEPQLWVKRGSGKVKSNPDASIAAYGEVIARLAAEQVPMLFVRWNLEDHPTDDPEYFALARILARYRGKTKVYFVLPSDQIERLPIGIASNSDALEDDGCGSDRRETLSDCAYIPDNHRWVIQKLLEAEVPPRADGERPAWVSNDLPSGSASFILHLPPSSALVRRTFTEVLNKAAPDGPWQAAFIGSSAHVSGGPAPSASSSAVVRTIYDQLASGPEAAGGGTPQHVFWAMLAQMFAANAEVSVVSRSVVLSLTVGLCATLIALTIVYDISVGLAVFLVLGFNAPLINAAAMRWGHTYVPLFDAYYFGLSALFVAGLMHLGILAVQRWRLEAQSRLQTRAVDLKGNFISLLTHNLNTPVAKMQGMLALLVKQAGGGDWSRNAELAEALVTQLEYSIRSVLIAAALEEGVMHLSARHTAGLLDDVLDSSSASLKKLGVRLKAGAVTSGDEGGEYLPLTFDLRALSAAVAAAAALFHRDGSTAVLQLAMAVSHDGGDDVLAVTLTSTDVSLTPEVTAILTTPTPQLVRSVTDADFFPAVLAGLVHLTTKTFRGGVTWTLHGSGGELRLVFLSEASRQSNFRPGQE